jgi:proline dehydrogenase
MAESPAIERFVKTNGMSKGFASRFIAGEWMEDIVEPVRALNARGLTVTLDYLGENTRNEAEAAEAAACNARLFKFIADHRLDANVSLKLTQLGLDLGDEMAERHLRSILDEAAETSNFVRIDMESSAHTQQTLDLFYRVWRTHKNVGAVIQSYLFRSAEDVERLMEAGARVRLVKGAYAEPADIAFARKADVDANYVKLMQELLARGNYPAIATHDEAIIVKTQGFATERQIPSSRYEFQMLYGIRRDLQLRLVSEGYRMRVYVPFGSQWYSYLMRRLAERPANLWFVLRNLLRR